MKLFLHKRSILLLSLIIFFFSYTGTRAAGNEIIWKEGRSRIRLTVSPDEVAEINLNNRGFTGGISSYYKGAIRVYDSHRIRIWKVTGSVLRKSLLRGELPANLRGNHSPVLRDSSGRRRILMGNVVVMMKKSMSSDDVSRWAAGKNLVILRQLSKFSNSYLIQSPPGLESLNLAASLQEDVNVVSSSPDWYSDISLK